MYKFSEKSMHPFLSTVTCVDKIMSTDRGQKDGQMDTDSQTDGQSENNIPPNFVWGVYKSLIMNTATIFYLQKIQWIVIDKRNEAKDSYISSSQRQIFWEWCIQIIMISYSDSIICYLAMSTLPYCEKLTQYSLQPKL